MARGEENKALLYINRCLIHSLIAGLEKNGHECPLACSCNLPLIKERVLIKIGNIINTLKNSKKIDPKGFSNNFSKKNFISMPG